MPAGAIRSVAGTHEARPHPAGASVSRLLAVAVLGGVVLGLLLAVLPGGVGGRPLFVARFARAGLVTNEYAYYNHASPLSVRSPDWVATSGSLFSRDGGGWTGVPDGQAPDPRSLAATDSAVFRLRTRRADFGNVAVSFKLRIDRVLTTQRTPAQDYDGVHVWLRYQNPNWLYFASVSRRDGRIVIGKKLPTASGGRYADIVRVPDHPFPLNRWVSIRVSITSHGTTVVIRVLLDGRLVASAVDDGSHGPPILRPGHVGLRGDNTQFRFKNFEISSA